MTREKDCRGVVRFLDGHEEEIVISAVRDDEGLLIVPHILTLGKKAFRLVNCAHEDEDYFLYMEEDKPKVPYDIHLH